MKISFDNRTFPNSRNNYVLFIKKKKKTEKKERRGALGYIRNRKTEEKNHPKPQNRKKIRPKPKTAYKPSKTDTMVTSRAYRAN